MASPPVLLRVATDCPPPVLAAPSDENVRLHCSVNDTPPPTSPFADDAKAFCVPVLAVYRMPSQWPLFVEAFDDIGAEYRSPPAPMDFRVPSSAAASTGFTIIPSNVSEIRCTRSSSFEFCLCASSSFCVSVSQALRRTRAGTRGRPSKPLRWQHGQPVRCFVSLAATRRRVSGSSEVSQSTTFVPFGGLSSVFSSASSGSSQKLPYWRLWERYTGLSALDDMGRCTVWAWPPRDGVNVSLPQSPSAGRLSPGSVIGAGGTPR
mmetsp:Transcript_37342/g.101098  ORF Transcript_37342/g.101098 Transcript_37342/m.101098 type:complete len:263 (+) Transcript_37342:651-1439(+)